MDQIIFVVNHMKLAIYTWLLILLDNIMFSTDPNLEDEEYEMSSRIDGIDEDVVSSRINFGDLGGFAGQVICTLANIIF